MPNLIFIRPQTDECTNYEKFVVLHFDKTCFFFVKTTNLYVLILNLLDFLSSVLERHAEKVKSTGNIHGTRLYMNDLTEFIKPTKNLLADDTKLYKEYFLCQWYRKFTKWFEFLAVLV